MSALLHICNFITSRTFGLIYFQLPLGHSGQLHIPKPALVSLVLSKFLVKHVTSNNGGIMLHRGSLASGSYGHVQRHSLLLHHGERSHGALKELPALHLALWLLKHMCYTDTDSPSQSVRW